MFWLFLQDFWLGLYEQEEEAARAVDAMTQRLGIQDYKPINFPNEQNALSTEHASQPSAGIPKKARSATANTSGNDQLARQAPSGAAVRGPTADGLEDLGTADAVMRVDSTPEETHKSKKLVGPTTVLPAIVYDWSNWSLSAIFMNL